MRLLYALVNLLDLKIINRRMIGLKNINAVVDDSIDGKKIMTVCDEKAR